MRKLALSLIVVFSSHIVAAQNDDKGGVAIHADSRLAVLLRKTHTYVRPSFPDPPAPKPPESVKTVLNPGDYLGKAGLIHHDRRAVTYTGRGYRVQIYNGPDRNKAVQIKTEFMRRFPGVSTYISYVAPGFRVKIGDYRNRSDAEGMLREANSMYTPSMIVPDEVTLTSW
jgi:1,2-phenylacetyl-CoA epoxidase PaaB subunit